MLRSKFVHEAQLVLELGDTAIHVDGIRIVRCDLFMSAVFDTFELELLGHFGRTTSEFY